MSFQVYLDQCVFAPGRYIAIRLTAALSSRTRKSVIGITGFYFGAMTLLEGKSFSEAQSRIEKVCPSTAAF